MPRQLRISYPGAVYRVMNRGDQRESVFHDDLDWKGFVADQSELLERALPQTSADRVGKLKVATEAQNEFNLQWT